MVCDTPPLPGIKEQGVAIGNPGRNSIHKENKPWGTVTGSGFSGLT